MRKTFLAIITVFICFSASAQVPFFGSSTPKNEIFSYTQLEFSPKTESQGIFIFTQYGVTDRFNVGVEFVGGTGWLTQGFNLKYQFVAQDYLNLALQTSTSMSLNHNYRFDNQNISLFYTGSITEKLGYVGNTYFWVDRESNWTSNQYWFLTYNIKRVTPFIGMTHHWVEDFNPDLTIGLAFNLNAVNLYTWSGYLFSGAPVFTIGFDYQFSTKR